MKKLFKKFLWVFVVAGLFASFGVWSETGRAVAHKAARPLVWLSSQFVFHPLHSLRHYFTTRHELRRKNKQLQREMEELRHELLLAREISKENERLRSLLHFQDEVKSRTVAARVVGRDPTQWFRGITIDKGSADGLKLNMPVVTHDGLVGKISALSATMAQVNLIVDYSSRAGGILQESREVGILTGEGTFGCSLLYISRNAVVKKGETVLTSGVGSLYPKGLVIGKVRDASMEKGGVYQTAKIDPSVDFGKLEEVLVLVSTQ